jgi:cobalt-zinc-cadmium efflux system outer membrane protein
LGWELGQTIKMYKKVVCLSIVSAVLTQNLFAQEQGTSVRSFTLETLEAAVFSSNPELQYYEQEIEAAKQGSKTAGRLQNPNLSAQVGQWMVDDLAGTKSDGLAWSLSVLQPIEFPKRLQLKRAIANRDIDMAELGLAHFKALLSERAKALGFKLYTFQKRSQSAKEVASRVGKVQAIMIQRDPAGIAPLLETRILESAVLSAQKQAGDAELEEKKLTVAIHQLMGDFSADPIRILMGDISFDTAASNESLLAAAYETDFGIRMRGIELEQQGFKVELRKNEQMPTVSLGPYYGQQEASDAEASLGLGLSINLPLWNNGSSRTEIERIRLKQAQASLEMTRREVAADLMNALQTYSLRVQSMKMWRDGAEERFREAAALGDRHYQLGAITISTYVDLQTAYVEAIDTLLETQEQAFIASLKIKTLTGINFVLEGTLKP